MANEKLSHAQFHSAKRRSSLTCATAHAGVQLVLVPWLGEDHEFCGHVRTFSRSAPFRACSQFGTGSTLRRHLLNSAFFRHRREMGSAGRGGKHRGGMEPGSPLPISRSRQWRDALGILSIRPDNTDCRPGTLQLRSAIAVGLSGSAKY